MKYISVFLLLFCSNISMKAKMNFKKVGDDPIVHKKILPNGMTVLVRPVHTIPKVSTQLWYNVGSKDEQNKERGIAHLIEHMIFKGTEKLSESDINEVTHKLSGNCNAFTSYDYTGYLFNFPSQHWHESLNIMSDCMRNCTFKEYMLSSEMKAVIQELKMYKDLYTRSLIDEMIGIIFSDHPYHHPIIGYKQDLWSVSSDDLMAFYKKHYVPNNATLVVVGDVQPEEVFALAEAKFGAIPADPNYKKEETYFNRDLVSKSITLYREVKKPTVAFAYVIPGITAKKDSVLELLSRIMGYGKGSRLYKRLVNEERIATDVSCSSEELFDHGLFFIVVEPNDAKDIDKIEAIIKEEVQKLEEDGVSNDELSRVIKKTEVSLYSLLENLEHQAYEIGKFYLATGDEHYLFNYLNKSASEIKKEMHEIATEYLRPSMLHKGVILPLPESEKETWKKVQKESDIQDERILSARKRDEEIEGAVYANTVEVKKPGVFPFPKAIVSTLDNGLKVFSYHNDNIPIIDITLDFKAKHYYDPEEKQGLSLFVSKMMLEGTTNYSGPELIDAIESRGMSIAPYPGGIALRMAAEDLPIALDFLNEILTQVTFDEKAIEKVREQLLSKLKTFWDEPQSFTGQLVREVLYDNHPYKKNSIGTTKSIHSILRDDLASYYKQYITPQGARLAIVGDISQYNLNELLQEKLGNWKGEVIEDLEYPTLTPQKQSDINYPINRDQVVLRFAGLSVERNHPDFDALLLYDQIFSGGALGSMSSRLFQLREQSGLFYTIGGSLISGADEHPGMVLVQTIVSKDRLAEAEKAILDVIMSTPETITDSEFEEAKNAVINAQVDNFASNSNIANALLFVDRFKYEPDFFDTRAEKLRTVTLQQSKDAAKRVLANALMTVRVGRIEEAKKA